MKSQYIIIGNWKMHPVTGTEAKKISSDVVKAARSLSRVEIVLAPSFVHIPLISLSGKKVSLGAQDVCGEEKGSFTGEVSIDQLTKLKVKYVIVGHSEKRALGDTEEIVNKKLKVVLRAKLTPVLCIGELVRDTQGAYLAFLEQELRSALTGVSRADLVNTIIAYEPIWAIGKGATEAMKPQDIHEVVLFIQKILASLYSREVSKKVKILYGAAVEPENAKDIVVHGNVQGLLIGHASLSIKTLGPILTAINSIKS